MSADMILPILREMRAENVALHEESRRQFAAIDRRLERIELGFSDIQQVLLDRMWDKLALLRRLKARAP